MSNDVHLSRSEPWAPKPSVVLSPVLGTSVGSFVSMKIKDVGGNEVIIFFRDVYSTFMVEDACAEARKRLEEAE